MTDAEETWRPIAHFEGRYEVSNLGRVRSVSRLQQCRRKAGIAVVSVHGKILKTNPDKDGYPRVLLWQTPQKQKMFQVHRLVCAAFNGPGNELHCEVAHLDGNPANPQASNLKWVGRVENHSHRKAHGTDQVGERHPRAKLTEDAVRVILASPGERASLAARFGVTPHAIDDVRRGKNWKHVRAEGLAQTTPES